MPTIPSGTVTFLFTDIVGSTQLWEAFPVQMKAAFTRQEAILRQVMAKHGGYVYKMIGDAFQVAFEMALPALEAAIEAQRRLCVEDWGETPVRVRMALHSGVTEERGDDYVGPALNRVARMLAGGYGGQVLLSQATFQLVIDDLPRGVELRDMGEHRLRDLVRPEHIYQLVAAGLPDDFPPLRTFDAFLNNLPIQRTSFIGREVEMEQIRQLFTGSRAGLVTLVGPGGTGKTRLALQAGVQLHQQFMDGVWIVELATVAEPARMFSAVAEALGVREMPAKPVETALLEHLQFKNMLLILDNCEHIIEACAQLVAELLRKCPNVRILATSRELLGAVGEAPLRVPPLAAPDPRHLPDLEDLSHYDAVRLFTDRVIAVSPGFQLSASNAQAVAQICQRLDGIPLALELAAARTRIMSVEQIAAHLDDAFHLLTGGSRTVLPRQQTLRALIDWSYNLLSPDERHILALLSVFSGGWSLEAAMSVGDNPYIYDILGRLVDKSLVIAEPGDGSETRYRMLGTIQQYAGERLTESGAGREVRDRHLAFYLTLAEQAEPYLRLEEAAGWMDRLELEIDNIRQALDWSLAGGRMQWNSPEQGLGREYNHYEIDRIEVGLRLVCALMWFWHIRNRWHESVEWFEKLFEKGSGDGLTRAKALRALAFLLMHNRSATFETTRPMVEESIALCRGLGLAGRRELAITLVLLGGVFPDRERGLAMVTEGLYIFREEQDLFYIAEGLLFMGLIMEEKGDETLAREYLEESLALRRQIHDQDGIGYCLLSLGQAALVRGENAAALKLLKESGDYFRESGNQARLIRVHSTMSHLWLVQGDDVLATKHAQMALAISQEIDDPLETINALSEAGMLAWVSGHYSQAKAYSEEAVSLSREICNEKAQALGQYLMGRVAMTTGNLEEASQRLLPLLTLGRCNLDWKEAARILDSLGGLAAARGQWQNAAAIFGANEYDYEKLLLSLSPFERSEHDTWIRAARKALGESAFEAAWADGKAMARDQAVRFVANLFHA